MNQTMGDPSTLSNEESESPYAALMPLIVASLSGTAISGMYLVYSYTVDFIMRHFTSRFCFGNSFGDGKNNI